MYNQKKMKITFLAVFILSFNISTYSQAESVIFKRVIDDYVLKYRQPNIKYSSTTLIILEKPLYLRKLELNDFSRFKEKYKKFDENTFVDFIARNQDNFHIENDKYSDIDIIIVSQKQSKNRKELFAKYPNWNGSILEFSNIGFNERNDQAFLYYGFDSGSGTGGGFYIVFEKKKNNWKEKVVVPAWAT